MNAGRFAGMRNTCQVCGTPLLRKVSRERFLCSEHWAQLRARERVIRQRLSELHEETTTAQFRNDAP